VTEVDLARVAVASHDSGEVSWEMVSAAPHPALIGLVERYCGYRERSVRPVRRRVVATVGVHLIVSFGDPIDVIMPAGPARHTSFIAGLSDTFGDTEFHGRQHGVQIDLTPLGAFRLLGLPMRELANQVVDLNALPVTGGRRVSPLADRLASAPGWARRFALVDELLLDWLARGPEADPAVVWAWRRLERSHGQVAIGELASEIGWSRRHLVKRFAQQVGLPPKPAARVLRFLRAHRLLTTGTSIGSTASIADVAAACGYADHSHLVREFNRLGGAPPSAFLHRQPIVPEVPFVQDRVR
jgi:AraC-like DNA-binding protein